MNWQSWSRENWAPFPLRNHCPVPQLAKPITRPKNYRQRKGIRGCCTWYRFGESLTSDKILNLATECQTMDPNIEYVLIDDGWCSWGDWQNPTLPLKTISRKLSNMRLKTGLWLAPFLASPHSKIYQSHPEYFIPNLEGIKIFPFDKFLPYQKYVIDFSIPDAREYVYKSITFAIKKWNVSLLKLDFLYAPFFDPRLKDDLLPNKYLQELFTYIKTNFPDVFIMACGCPFESAKYLVDSIRISDDIAFPQFFKFPVLNRIYNHFNYHLLLSKWKKYSYLSKYFHLDPDVLPNPHYTHHTPNQMSQLKKIFDESTIKFYG
jgi:alpha-galactosidase